MRESVRNPMYSVPFVLSLAVAACGDSGGSGTPDCGPGELCACVTTEDCPEGETCSPGGFCVAESDAGPDGGDDVSEDVGEDTDPPDTSEDVSNDVDVVEDASDDDVEDDTTDVDTVDTADAADGQDVDTGATDADADTGGYVYDPVGPLEPLLNPWVAFVSRRSGSPRIWAVRADGTDLTLIDSGDLQPVSPAWGPDGTKLAYAYATPDGRRLRVLDVTSGDGPSYDVGLQSIATVAWAPDGSALAIEGRLPGASESDILILPLAEGATAFPLITDTGLDEVTPVWTDDGRVYFAQGEGDSFDVMYAVVGVDEAVFADVPDSVVGSFAVSRYGDFFVYVRRAGSASEMVRYEVATEQEEVLGGASDAEPFLSWDDGILMFVRSEGEPVNPELQLAVPTTGEILRVLAADPTSDTQPNAAPVESESVTLFWSAL